jgi:hypothetical protein
MMTMMFIIGAVLATHPPTNVNTVSPASIAMVVMIYLYVIGYSASWGPIPWVSLCLCLLSIWCFDVLIWAVNLICWKCTDQVNRST